MFSGLTSPCIIPSSLVAQAVGDLLGEAQDQLLVERFARLHQLVHAAAEDQLHDDVGLPFSLPNEAIWTMLWWLIRAAAWCSAKKGSLKATLSPRLLRITLIATARFSTSSGAVDAAHAAHADDLEQQEMAKARRRPRN